MALARFMQPAPGAQPSAFDRIMVGLLKIPMGWWDCAGGRCSAGEELWDLAQAPLAVVAGPEMEAAESIAQGARLTEHLRQVEKYGQAGYKELANGRIRYYGETEAARSSGEMVGRRLVREWNPENGATRTWHETLDSAGRTRIVRPETGGAKVHYEFDRVGNYVGSW